MVDAAIAPAAGSLDEETIDEINQRLFELRVEVQSSLSDVNIELASVKRKVHTARPPSWSMVQAHAACMQ